MADVLQLTVPGLYSLGSHFCLFFRGVFLNISKYKYIPFFLFTSWFVGRLCFPTVAIPDIRFSLICTIWTYCFIIFVFLFVFSCMHVLTNIVLFHFVYAVNKESAKYIFWTLEHRFTWILNIFQPKAWPDLFLYLTVSVLNYWGKVVHVVADNIICALSLLNKIGV